MKGPKGALLVGSQIALLIGLSASRPFWSPTFQSWKGTKLYVAGDYLGAARYFTSLAEKDDEWAKMMLALSLIQIPALQEEAKRIAATVNLHHIETRKAYEELTRTMKHSKLPERIQKEKKKLKRLKAVQAQSGTKVFYPEIPDQTKDQINALRAEIIFLQNQKREMIQSLEMMKQRQAWYTLRGDVAFALFYTVFRSPLELSDALNRVAPYHKHVAWDKPLDIVAFHSAFEKRSPITFEE